MTRLQAVEGAPRSTGQGLVEEVSRSVCPASSREQGQGWGDCRCSQETSSVSLGRVLHFAEPKERQLGGELAQVEQLVSMQAPLLPAEYKDLKSQGHTAVVFTALQVQQTTQ